MAKVRGIGYWVSVYSPNTTFTPKYCVDLIVDKEGKEQLESQGIQVKPDEERGGFLAKFSINAFKKDGSPTPKPKVVDRDGDPIDTQIGNGSEIIVAYHPYEWAYAGKTGVKGILEGVQIVKLVKFEARETFEPLPEEDEGNSVETSVEIDENEL